MPTSTPVGAGSHCRCTAPRRPRLWRRSWFARAGVASPSSKISERCPGRLAKLPIACTAWDDERLQTLRAMGVTRLGELTAPAARRSCAPLGSPRCCGIWTLRWRGKPAPRRAFVPRERFRARCDFETEIEHVAYLEKALEPLIERCAQFLRERQAGVQALRLKLKHRAGPATRVHLGLASITSERRRLMDVLTQKLRRLELPAPVRGMELISGSLRPLSAASLDVFAGLAGAGTGRPRQRAAIGGAFARPPGRGGGVWSCLNPGTSARSGMAARARTVVWPRPCAWTRGQPDSGLPTACRAPCGCWTSRCLALSRRIDSGTGPGTHRERLVGRQRRGARLLYCAPSPTRARMAQSSGFFRNVNPSAGMCTGYSRERQCAEADVRRTACLEQFLFFARRFAARGIDRAGQTSWIIARLALTDECSLAGVVRAHVAAKEHGSAADHRHGAHLHRRAETRGAGHRSRELRGLSRLISRARRAHVKGRYSLARADLENALDGCLIIWLPHAGQGVNRRGKRGRPVAARTIPGRLWIGVELLTGGFDVRRLETARSAGQNAAIAQRGRGRCAHAPPQPPRPAGCADGDSSRRAAASRGLCRVSERRALLAPSAALARALPRSRLLAQTLRIAERCTFTLDELRYEYPEEIVPAGDTPSESFARADDARLRAALAERASRMPCARTSNTNCV